MIRVRPLLVVPVVALALTACSQIDALAPVSGAAVTAVRNATYDVLVAAEVDILVAPQCSAVTSGFICEGSTVDGASIIAEATADAPYELTVLVGEDVLFDGTAQEVLEAAIQEAS